MIRVGGWEINFSKNYPQKIASAVSGFSTGFGCNYTPVAYLGSQVVNGTNHAVLMEQKVLNGEDTKNAVVVVFNEKPGSNDVSVVGIKTIVESGLPLGGVKVEISTTIPEAAKEDLDVALAEFVGSKITPYVYLGSQVTKGTNHIFLAAITAMSPSAKKELAIVIVNTLQKKIQIERVFLLGEKDDETAIGKLGYAFTW